LNANASFRNPERETVNCAPLMQMLCIKSTGCELKLHVLESLNKQLGIHPTPSVALASVRPSRDPTGKGLLLRLRACQSSQRNNNTRGVKKGVLPLKGSDLTSRHKPVHYRHGYVHQDEFELPLSCGGFVFLEGLEAIGSSVIVVAKLAHKGYENLEIDLVIVDEEDLWDVNRVGGSGEDVGRWSRNASVRLERSRGKRS
jgi:hypothetical protein